MDTAFWKDLPRAELVATKHRFLRRVPLARLGTVQEVAAAYLHLRATGSSLARYSPSTAG
jgi:NAD(P)-dependent dehydrogenase (short-subunit alcohol dehydrogenase family)